MRKIRITITVMLLSLIAVSSPAQEQTWTFGVRAGTNMAYFSKFEFGDSYTPGALLGVSAEYHILGDLYLQTGIEGVLRRTKISEDVLTDLQNITRYDVEYKTRSVYLQMPIRAAYKYVVNRDIKVVVNAGPYIAYGLDGKIKASYSPNPLSLQYPASVSSFDFDYFSEQGYKRFDSGIGFGLGAEYEHILSYIGYDWGLMNAKRGFGVMRTRNIYITLGCNI